MRDFYITNSKYIRKFDELRIRHASPHDDDHRTVRRIIYYNYFIYIMYRRRSYLSLTICARSRWRRDLRGRSLKMRRHVFLCACMPDVSFFFFFFFFVSSPLENLCRHAAKRKKKIRNILQLFKIYNNYSCAQQHECVHTIYLCVIN